MKPNLILFLSLLLFTHLEQAIFAQCSYSLVNNSSGSSYSYTTMPPVSGNTTITWYIGSNASGTSPSLTFPTSWITVMNTVCAEIIDSGCPQPIVICDTVANCDYQFTHHVSGNNIYLNNTPFVFSPAQISWTVNGNPITGTNDPTYTAPGPGTYIVCMAVVDPTCMINNTFYHCDTIVIPSVGCNYNFTYTLSGDSIQLNNTPQVQSPATISWTVNGNPITGTNDPLYIAPGPGTYMICMTVVDMNCQPNPTTYVCDTIVIPTTGCNYNFTYTLSGDSILLNNTPQVQSPATISWTVNGNPITGTNDPLYIAPGPGTYMVCMVVVDMNCQPNPTTYVCDTITIPQSGCNYSFTYTLQGDTLSLVNTPQVNSPATIQWTVNGNVISNSNNPIHNLGGPGVYEVCVFIFNPVCTLNNTYYHCDTVYIYGVGNDAEVQRDLHLEISPNPAVNSIKVNLPVEFVTENGVIEIYDLFGKRLMKLHTHASEEQKEIQISLEDLKSGMYFMQVSGTSSKATGRFQVIR
jgi:hypothetical protein